MKNIKKVLVLLVIFFAAAVLTACPPEAESGAQAAAGVAANQITIFEVGANGASVAITALVPLQIGDVRTLSVEVLPANATDKAVTWSSSDDSIVSIDASGKLTAQASGNATITASAGGAAATLAVSVAYSVTTEAGLRAMANNLAGYYVLKGDINLTQEWTPLGSFTGTLDGAGFSVKNLWMNQPLKNFDGMGFITYNSGTIKNIGLEIGAQGVRGGDFFGALVGLNYGTVSGRVSGTGKVTGLGQYTGALVGGNRGTVIGYAMVAVEGQGTTGTGGLVGNSSGTVIGYATGAVTGALYVGGLIGVVASGTVIGYATGAVSGTRSDGGNVNFIGGLIGYIGGSIYGYARGAVSTDREGYVGSQKQTLIGPAGGRGDGSASGGADNMYYSGKSGESGFSAPAGITKNTLGKPVNVTAGDDPGALAGRFDKLASSDWLFYTGKWPAINFPADQSIFDDMRGDKQPLNP